MDSRQARYHLLPRDEADVSFVRNQADLSAKSKFVRETGRSKTILLTPTLQILVLCLLVIETALLGFLTVGKHIFSTSNGGEVMIETQFGLDKEFMTLDHTFDDLWNETATSGLISLSSNLVDATPEIGAIAMFHQLHCLAGIRKALQDSREGIDIGIDYHDNNHWPHCLDYLRKVVLCYADATIEQHDIFKNGTATDSISGSMALRQCRPNQPLYDRAERDHL